MAEHAGLAENAELAADEYERGNGSGRYGMRQVTILNITFNPVVSFGAAVLLWGLVVLVSVEPEETVEEFKEWQSWVTRSMTWLYIASQDYWLLYLFPLVYYYGHVKLGKDNEEPEYSDGAYFSMVFSAGVAIGLIFYGASEPVSHMLSGNRYSDNGYSNDNQKAQDALNLTVFHWGIQAWIVYALTAVSMGFLCYKKDLPLCFRTTLVPLFGKAMWGWLGDLIDIITIWTIVAGLCTSLGMGAQQIVAGMQRLEWLDTDLDEDAKVRSASIVIAVITGCATLSVVLGLDYGIKTMSMLAFILGNFLLCTTFFLDMPWFILNVIVQTAGYHVQNMIEISTHCDAFAQLYPGEGAPNDGAGANKKFMDWWTIFYWGWWIAWAPFVGTFLAKISRGRTIKNIILYTLSVPFFYSLVWFCTFGGAGIRMHRRALFLKNVGLIAYNDADHYVAKSDLARPATAGNCYDVPKTLPTAAENMAGYKDYEANAHVSPVCEFTSGDSNGFWFDLMSQYHGMGRFLSIVSVFTIVCYFVTSSDSGSLVVDLIAANGRDAHVVQRVFWALSEGAVAIALMQAGSSQALKAMQALSIVAGLPFTVLLMFMCTALWRALKIDQGDMLPRKHRVDWALPLYAGVFDCVEVALSLGTQPMPQVQDVMNFFLGLFAPPLLLFKSVWGLNRQAEKAGKSVGAGENSVGQDIFMIIASCALYLAFLVLHILALAGVNRGLSGLGWGALVAFTFILTPCRSSVRRVYGIEGSGFEDFFICLFFYPQVLAQMVKQVSLTPPKSPVAQEVKEMNL